MTNGSSAKNLSEYTVHMVGNSHIDPVWQWRWEEGRNEVIDTCRSAVERAQETPDFVFTRSSAVTYQWIEQVAPELFADIKRLVVRGNWCIVGGWWVQPDCNIPCGESLVRQGLYGQRYFIEKFGMPAKTAYNVDTFGHAATLPQIFLKQGMGQYCFFRPGPDEKELPANLFWWQAPDGSRVLAARMPGHYLSQADEIEQRIYEAAEQSVGGLRHTMSFYGVGNHGGGPTKANIRSIQKVNEAPDGPRAIFSSPDTFFDAIRQDAESLPTVKEELQYHSRGCYTAVSAIKKHNRLAENMLLQAEKMSCMAGHLVGARYPRQELEYAWKQVLFNQFHDILAGTSIRPACDDAILQYQEAETIAGRAIRQAMTHISQSIDTAGEGRPVVIYNTLSWPREEVVELEVTWPNHNDNVRVVDDRNQPVPYQVLSSTISGRGTTIRLLIRAELPACGYRVYRVLQATQAEPGNAQATPFRAGSDFVESDIYRLEFDPATGYITRLFDKRLGQDLLAGPANVPIVIDDPSDTWSHGVDSFRTEIGRFQADKNGIEVVEVGPVRLRVRVTMSYKESALVQDIRLYARLPRIDVKLTVDYHGHNEMLKIAFPTAIEAPTATYEVPYGHVVRPQTGCEEPAQKWADISGRLADDSEAGIAILNDAKYGYDALDGQLRLSVLRTPIYCFHEPSQPDCKRRYEFTDQGSQQFTYALLPHKGDWRQGDVVRQAQQLNHPSLVREEPAHTGSLPLVFSLANVDAANVIVEVVKQHEDSNNLVLRAYETHGEQTDTMLQIAHQPPVRLFFTPYEIKTVLLADGEATELDMLERTEG